MKFYPEHKWDMSRFSKRPKDFWKAEGVSRSYLIDLGRKLGIEMEAGSFEKWYNVSINDLVALGGGSLLVRYNFSLSRMLAAIFPEFAWDEARFSSKPQHYWQSLDNQRTFLHALAKTLGIESISSPLFPSYGRL